MKPYDIFIRLIIIVKILFIILALIHRYLTFTKQEYSKLGIQVQFWKSRIEFIFIFLMSLLLIYLFNPRFNRSVLVNRETKFILFLFGIVLIITADWNDFFNESQIFQTIQKLLGGQQ